MDDTDEFAWKKDRPCAAPIACDRSATVGYDTCSRCRLWALVRRRPEVLGPLAPADRARFLDLPEQDALAVERPFRAALNARATARNALARALGAPTLVRPEGGDAVTCTFAEVTDAR